MEFAEGKRPATASDLSRLQRQQQQEEADSECSASVASRATGRGQQLYERGMEMKHRQEQIRDQLRQVCQPEHHNMSPLTAMHNIVVSIRSGQTTCIVAVLSVTPMLVQYLVARY